MATKAFKQEKADSIKAKMEKAKVAIVTEYKGMTVEEIQYLRRELQKIGGDYMVTKNTLAKLAVKGTEYEMLTETFKGPIAVAFGFEDPAAPAKVLAKFIKEKKKGVIVAAGLDGQLLNADQTKELANLPSKEELYAKMLGCVNSPATGIAGAVNAVMSSLVRAIDAVAKKKDAA
ncbi:50S ribosomal protein L10 [bacterium]|nr:50S ribosomal protein L10 [bacterium]